jgi:hypothetical protein
MMLLPPGATSSMSKSSGKVWLILFIVTVTFVTVPTRPATVISDEYGLPGPTAIASFSVIGDAFEKTTADAGIAMDIIKSPETHVARTLPGIDLRNFRVL